MPGFALAFCLAWFGFCCWLFCDEVLYKPRLAMDGLELEPLCLSLGRCAPFMLLWQLEVNLRCFLYCFPSCWNRLSLTLEQAMSSRLAGRWALSIHLSLPAPQHREMCATAPALGLEPLILIFVSPFKTITTKPNTNKPVILQGRQWARNSPWPVALVPGEHFSHSHC